MCFDLRELLIPCEEPRDLCVAHCDSSARRRRSRTNSMESVASIASKELSYVPPRPERFQDAYVLTRQVR